MIDDLEEFELHGQLPLARDWGAFRLLGSARTAEDLGNLVFGGGGCPAGAAVDVGVVIGGGGGGGRRYVVGKGGFGRGSDL